mgnify:CR=1 FL=1
MAGIEEGTPEAGLLAVWCAEAVRPDPILGPPSNAMKQRTLLDAQVMPLRLRESALGSLIDERALMGILTHFAA